MRRLWRDYNLTIVAVALFLVTFLAWALVAWKDYASETDRHGTSTDFGAFMSRFWAFTLENWQSEFLHVVVLVVMTALLIHRGSAESRDSDDRMEAALERIEERLPAGGDDRLEAALTRIEERLPASGDDRTAAALARIEERLEALERRGELAAAAPPDEPPASATDRPGEDRTGALGAVRALARRARRSR